MNQISHTLSASWSIIKYVGWAGCVSKQRTGQNARLKRRWPTVRSRLTWMSTHMFKGYHVSANIKSSLHSALLASILSAGHRMISSPEHIKTQSFKYRTLSRSMVRLISLWKMSSHWNSVHRSKVPKSTVLRLRLRCWKHGKNLSAELIRTSSLATISGASTYLTSSREVKAWWANCTPSSVNLRTSSPRPVTFRWKAVYCSLCMA